MQIDDLIRLEGIGEKTLQDIKRQYSTVEDLRRALAKDKVGLRDDVVELLRRELDITRLTILEERLTSLEEDFRNFKRWVAGR